jgi:hypothetical protein
VKTLGRVTYSEPLETSVETSIGAGGPDAAPKETSRPRGRRLARDMDGEMVFFLPRAAHPGLYDQTTEYIESTGAKPILREVISVTHTMEFVAHNFGVALLPRSASRLSHMGVLFKPITDKLLWIETALFFAPGPERRKMQWFLPELPLQIKNATLDR